MKAKISRLLVIDTDILQSAGKKDVGRSKICRELLLVTKEVCHKVAFDPSSYSEWKNHRSNFSSTWLYSMKARKKFIKLLSSKDDVLRQHITTAIENHNDRETVLKDIHLLENAFATDKIIISFDTSTKRILDSIVNNVKEVRNIMWINPESNDIEMAEWLRNGALMQSKLMLGYKP